MLRSLTALTLAAAVVAALASAATAASGAPDPGAIGVRLVDVPAATQDDPRARLYIVDHLAPGTVIKRRIEVTNTTATTAHVALYPAAATITANTFLGAAGHTKNDLSTWTSISPARPDIPAHGSVQATVTIKVPKDAAPGEQYGVVWAEVASAPAGASGGIAGVSRVGVRLYLDIGPGGPPAANFTIDSLIAQRSPDGTPKVVASVHNTGGRALDMGGTLQLRGGPGGLSAGPFPAVLGTTLAIGAVAPVAIVLDSQVPAGPWDAKITLRSGLVKRSAEATLTFPAAGVAAPVIIKAADHSGRLYLLVAGLSVMVLVVALGQIVRRRRRRRPGSPSIIRTHARAHAHRP